MPQAFGEAVRTKLTMVFEKPGIGPKVRLALAFGCWWLEARFMSLGYRLTTGMSYSDYIKRDNPKERE